MKIIRLIIGSIIGLSSVHAVDLAPALQRARDNAPEIRAYLDWAAATDDPEQLAAAKFTVAHMPPRDLTALDAAFLQTNHQLAFQARAAFPWAKSVPFEIFCNDVLPYASLDESREAWRQSFWQKARPIVADSKTNAEAAQALNRKFFDRIAVHYDTGRKRPNQSPSESIQLGMATCTGLSIILVDACRAVGIPARIAGIASWPEKRGNHTWVEIWHDGSWHFTGADEYDAEGLDRAWFTRDAATANSNTRQHAIWATSWRQTDAHFPMVWNPQDHSVPAVDVTSRYAATPETDTSVSAPTVYLRMFDTPGGQRIAAKIELQHAGKTHQLTTRAGQADLNDMPGLPLPAASTHPFSAAHDGTRRRGSFTVPAADPRIVDLYWDQLDAPTPIKTDDSFENQWQAWLALPAEKRPAAYPQSALSKKQAARIRRDLW